MRSNIGLQMVMAGYLTVATVGYVILSYLVFGHVEPIGTIVIGFTVLLSLLIAFFLYSGLSKDSVLPEDRLDGEIADDSGEVGFFSPWSWWPIALGLACAMLFLSLAVGWWVTFIAVPLAIVAVLGFVYEYSRGAHAH
jgi:hypothetical protein